MYVDYDEFFCFVGFVCYWWVGDGVCFVGVVNLVDVVVLLVGGLGDDFGLYCGVVGLF